MVTYRRKKMRGSSAVTSHIIQRGRSYSALPADEHFCFVAIFNAYYNAKESAFQHFSSSHWEGDRGRFCVSCFSRKKETQNRPLSPPCLLPEPSPGVFLILHAVMGGFAVELQGPDIVSVVEKPGNEIVHGIDGIFLCVMAQDDTGVLIGEI